MVPEGTHLTSDGQMDRRGGNLPLCVEGVLQGEQLVEKASERPYVRLIVVRVVLKYLRRHVIRRSDAGASKVASPSEKLRQPSAITSGRREEEQVKSVESTIVDSQYLLHISRTFHFHVFETPP